MRRWIQGSTEQCPWDERQLPSHGERKWGYLAFLPKSLLRGSKRIIHEDYCILWSSSWAFVEEKNLNLSWEQGSWVLVKGLEGGDSVGVLSLMVKKGDLSQNLEPASQQASMARLCPEKQHSWRQRHYGGILLAWWSSHSLCTSAQHPWRVILEGEHKVVVPLK